MENNYFRVKKVSIQSLIDTLNNLYHRGIDFVDVEGNIGNVQDKISFIYCKSYMDEKYRDNFDNFDDEQIPSQINVELSDEDLDQLI